MKIKVAIAGVNGRMGRAAVSLLSGHQEFELVGALGRKGADYIGRPIGQLLLPAIDEAKGLVYDDLHTLIAEAKPDVIYDVSNAGAALEHSLIALNSGVRVVIGTSGLSQEQLNTLANLSSQHKVGCLVVPNFSIGAVLMMEFAQQAAKHFANVEVLEIHHNRKADAPSGTAVHTLNKMASQQEVFNVPLVQEHETMTAARGAAHESGLRVHSMRLPGLISHQEVFLAGEGEMLTIKHDSFNTSCFSKGVLLSLRAVMKLEEFVIGLEKVL
jgi:4-hydroxy-tetrahydrodipicolinate reductase